jgi:hypothetical protein
MVHCGSYVRSKVRSTVLDVAVLPRLSVATQLAVFVTLPVTGMFWLKYVVASVGADIVVALEVHK